MTFWVRKAALFVLFRYDHLGNACVVHIYGVIDAVVLGIGEGDLPDSHIRIVADPYNVRLGGYLCLCKLGCGFNIDLSLGGGVVEAVGLHDVAVRFYLLLVLRKGEGGSTGQVNALDPLGDFLRRGGEELYGIPGKPVFFTVGRVGNPGLFQPPDIPIVVKESPNFKVHSFPTKISLVQDNVHLSIEGLGVNGVLIGGSVTGVLPIPEE